MVSSAVYRYFASRDELLTALIIDAYDALGEAAERAEAAVRRTDLRGRWLATCHAIRGWSRATPPSTRCSTAGPCPATPPPRTPSGRRRGRWS